MKVIVAEGESFDGVMIYGIFSSRDLAITHLESQIMKEKEDGTGFTHFDKYTIREIELDKMIPNEYTDVEVVFDMCEYNDGILNQELD